MSVFRPDVWDIARDLTGGGGGRKLGSSKAISVIGRCLDG